MNVLVCDSPIVNNACASGWKSVSLQELTPQYMDVDQLKEVMPVTLLFLAACWCWRQLNKR